MGLFGFGKGSGKSGGGSKKGNSSSRGFGGRAVPGTSYKGSRSTPHSTHQSGKTSAGHSKINK